MLDINVEFRKGILFIRLYGELTSNTIFKVIKEVSFLIRENGFDNIVFNLKGIFKLDKIGINAIYKTYQIIEKEHGKILLCESDSKEVNFILRKSYLNKFVTVLPNELSAFNLVEI